MDWEDFPWLWIPGALMLVSLILHGVDEPWMTPLYIAEMAMFFILGAEISAFSEGKPLAAFLSVLIWIGGQLLLWMAFDRSLLWLVVLLNLAVGYIYFFTDRMKPRKIEYAYENIGLLLLLFFSVARIALAPNLTEGLWALGILLIVATDLFQETRFISLSTYRKHRWISYLAPLGALVAAYTSIAVVAPGLPLAIV